MRLIPLLKYFHAASLDNALYLNYDDVHATTHFKQPRLSTQQQSAEVSFLFRNDSGTRPHIGRTYTAPPQKNILPNCIKLIEVANHF